ERRKPTLLIILDGFGISPDKIGSPWEAAKHPTFSEIEKNYPFTALQASGIAVGLPWGKEGNSEVGHFTIGAGRIILNSLPRISTAIHDGTFFKNEAFLKAAGRAKSGGSLHIMGLFSSGTVHSYAEHLYALLDMAKQQGVERVFLHLFTDGKDAYMKEGADFFQKLEAALAENYPNAKLASIIGRKYAMDRDGNWDRTEKAFKLFTERTGAEFENAAEYIKNQYEKGIFDESIPGAKREGEEGGITDGDAVIFFNFREDSVRQLTRAFTDENFKEFERPAFNNLLFVTMTEYDKNLPILPAFKSAEVEWPLARVISENKLKQLHIAESEKYAHITYFLNGGVETPFENEDRILVPSPRAVSYDQTPEMSADKITDAVVSNMENYDFIAVNFVSPTRTWWGTRAVLKRQPAPLKKLTRVSEKFCPKFWNSAVRSLLRRTTATPKKNFIKSPGKNAQNIQSIPFRFT
ncbi:MAG: 2,3-bisphosphoglycerate-independent phosphoglycerate mutase, partial [bacterium]|nr:2,3-bisphosphoglycerate-independent phosphoglycerate mutase [bacterium]